MSLNLGSICFGFFSSTGVAVRPSPTSNSFQQLRLPEFRFRVCESALTLLRIQRVPLARGHQRLRLAVTYSALRGAASIRTRVFPLP